MPVAVELDPASTGPDLPGEADFGEWVNAACAGQPAVPRLRIHVRIVDEPESAELNLRYRDRSGPTNVLSFPVGEPVEDDELLLGDLVLCAPVIAHEARVQGKELQHHWAHITVHGTLHLLGFDHVDEEQALVMEAREREVLAGFSIPDPYRDAADTPPGAAA